MTEPSGQSRPERAAPHHELDEDDNVTYLTRALTDPIERRATADLIRELAERRFTPDLLGTVPPLVRMLRASDPHARTDASRALASLRAEEALPDLSTMAERDDVPWVRAWALVAVAAIAEEEEATPLLLRALSDPDWRVRHAAVLSLRESTDPAILGALTSAMKRESWSRRRAYRKTLKDVRRRSKT